MRVFVNGEARQIETGASVADVLGELGLDPTRVAVELDREIVARDAFESAVLADEARLEVVRFVSGG